MNQLQLFMQNDRILMLALDHRGSLERMLPLDIPSTQREKTMIQIKQMLLSSLSSYYSGVLLDATYGLAAYQAYEATHPQIPLKPYLLCIEKTGYTDTNHERLTQLEYTVAQLKAKGAQGVKLLLFYHPKAQTAAQQLTLTQQVFTSCKEQGLPFFLEILNYPLGEETYDPAVLVSQSVEIFLQNDIRADVFKLEFPGSVAACQKVTDLLGDTPWILLTKGETYEKFTAGLKIAIANGARGFLAGRSIWQDFAHLPQSQWQHFFETTVKDRFAQICEIATA